MRRVCRMVQYSCTDPKPYFVQHHQKENNMQNTLKLRMNGRMLVLGMAAALAVGSCRSLQQTTAVKQVPADMTPQRIFNNMKRAADWQIDNIQHEGWRHKERDWTNGALYAGLLSFARLANDSSYYTFMKEVGNRFGWQLVQGKARYFADHYCVGQMYCQMYAIYQDPKMIADLKLLADTLIARPHQESLEWKNSIQLREWAWCDGLFMGPPSLAMLGKVTGQQKYLDLVDSLWWKTTAYLYDPQHQLYYRDGSFLHKKEKNGQPVFWSRGNGWVMGGLVRVLENMPADYPDRKRWEKLYKDMAAKIITLQQADGTWHASLLDPEAYPSKETSGSGFYCYALAWGINHGLLAKKYAPVVYKSWQALTDCLHPNGMLGYVQRIAGSPGKVGYEDTEVYAVGAYLLAGSEVLQMVLNTGRYGVDETITNNRSHPQTLNQLIGTSAAKQASHYLNILNQQTLNGTTEVAGATRLYLQAVD